MSTISGWMTTLPLLLRPSANLFVKTEPTAKAAKTSSPGTRYQLTKKRNAFVSRAPLGLPAGCS